MAAMISSRLAETGKDSGNSIFRDVDDKEETSVKIYRLGGVIAGRVCDPWFPVQRRAKSL
jgi:hypothetical protein